MNKLVKDQLSKCKTCKIPAYDDSTIHLEIPLLNQVSQNTVDIQLNHYYIIQVEKYILNPPENFNLASNWNHNKNPVSEYLLITPKKFLGKMVQFDGCGWDKERSRACSDIYSDFWLPRKSFSIIEEISQ